MLNPISMSNTHIGTLALTKSNKSKKYPPHLSPLPQVPHHNEAEPSVTAALLLFPYSCRISHRKLICLLVRPPQWHLSRDHQSTELKHGSQKLWCHVEAPCKEYICHGKQSISNIFTQITVMWLFLKKKFTINCRWMSTGHRILSMLSIWIEHTLQTEEHVFDY